MKLGLFAKAMSLHLIISLCDFVFQGVDGWREARIGIYQKAKTQCCCTKLQGKNFSFSVFDTSRVAVATFLRKFCSTMEFLPF